MRQSVADDHVSPRHARRPIMLSPWAELVSRPRFVPSSNPEPSIRGIAGHLPSLTSPAPPSTAARRGRPRDRSSVATEDAQFLP